MNHHESYPEILGQLYATEEYLSRILAPFGVTFSPILLQGGVADPGIYNLPGLTPVATQTATYTAAGTPVTDTYTGVGLWNLLNDTGGVTVTSAKNDILSKYVVATGSDGYQAVYSLGEIDPSFGNQPVMVAYADTSGQLGPHGSDGLARIVVPGDQAGGRYVSDLVSLKVESLPEPGPGGPGGIADQLMLSGKIADPGIVTPETLSALNQSITETATYISGSGQTTDTYTGVSLWTLIQDFGVLTDSSIKNDILRYAVVATGSDGYRAIISMGEIDPGDHAGGRYVSNLVSLQVIDAAGSHLG